MPDPAVNPTSAARPQYRNIGVSQILSYRLPLAGIASILHRISGALMFLVGLPLVLYLFQQSLTSEISFDAYRAFVSNAFVKLVLLVVIWAYVHHFCAGIRYLLLDVHVGVTKEQAKTSAAVVIGVSVALTAVIGLKLFRVF
jgi:succinate dehydrogenase / fumarate reductase cytochrome b subunit